MGIHQPSLRAFKFIDGRVVLVGKAEVEIDHGKPFWLCSTMPPLQQVFMPVSTRDEAIAWLRTEAGADEVFEGVALD